MRQHFQDIKLTTDQANAVDKLEAFLSGDAKVFILQGYAGSGKTTLVKGLVKHLIEKGQKCQLMAPTGRAAKVIHQRTGFEANTVHKGIYNFEELEEYVDKEDEDVTFRYQFKLRSSADVYNTIIIIDEASLLSDKYSEGEFFRFGTGYVLSDLITYTGLRSGTNKNKIVFVGDPAQLPPIGMNSSPALDPQYLMDKFTISSTTVEMKEVKRQTGDNSILAVAGHIRKSLTSGYFNDFGIPAGSNISHVQYGNFFEHYLAQEEPKMIVTYKNETALHLNENIRSYKYGATLPIQKTDRVIIGMNNYKQGIMNGEFAVVSDVESDVVTRTIGFRLQNSTPVSVNLTWRKITLMMPDEKGEPKFVTGYMLENFLHGDNQIQPLEQRALYIDFKNRNSDLKPGTEPFKMAIKDDPYFNCIQLKYGYAVTCHKAQGGEWDGVYVFWDKGVKGDFDFYNLRHDKIGKSNSEFYRWAYTAITRAAKQLYCINPPSFSSFSTMAVVDSKVNREFELLLGQSQQTINIKFSEVAEMLNQFGLGEVAVSLQDHFIELWYKLNQQCIAIEKWERLGYEIRYYFSRGNEKAAVKFWINAKNVFNPVYQKISLSGDSTALYADFINVMLNNISVVIDRNAEKLVFEDGVEEEKPFLKLLFTALQESLDADEVITRLEHMHWNERYTIENNGRKVVIDFNYNQDGFFTRVMPLEKSCDNPVLLNKIINTINQLKNN